MVAASETNECRGARERGDSRGWVIFQLRVVFFLQRESFIIVVKTEDEDTYLKKKKRPYSDHSREGVCT